MVSRVHLVQHVFFAWQFNNFRHGFDSAKPFYGSVAFIAGHCYLSDMESFHRAIRAGLSLPSSAVFAFTENAFPVGSDRSRSKPGFVS
jgi:hypothetical protein